MEALLVVEGFGTKLNPPPHQVQTPTMRELERSVLRLNSGNGFNIIHVIHCALNQ